MIFDGLDPDEKAFILSACEDDKSFKQFVLADIFKRNRRCESHARDIRKLKTWRAVQTAIGGMLVAIGAWVAARMLGDK